jgi:steroid delta-isomerase-like uncharacterized protein
MDEWWQQYLAAWNAHDPDLVAGFMTTNVVYEDLALGERFEGLDEVRAFVTRAGSEFSSDYTFESGTFVADGDRYAGEWVMRGIHDRSSAELAASGKRYEIRGVSVGTLEAGLIAANRDYWNMMSFLGQIGALPS